MKNVLKKLNCMLVLVAALLMITGCPKEPAGPDTHKVTVTTNVDVAAVTFTVEDGTTLEQIKQFPTDPVLDGYTFDGYYTTENEKFAKNKPITKDVVLFAKFTKNNTAANVTEEKSADGSTTTITTTTDETTGKTEVVSEKKEKDGSSTTTTTTTDETTGTKEVVTEKKETDGSSTTTKETTDQSGNTTVETTTTDNQGNTKTEAEVKPADNATVESLINTGIRMIAQENILEAKACFEAAYKLNPNDDQAKVVSALVDLASISTNEKLGKFFKDHLGIQNYPGTLNALIAGDWLKASNYEVEEPFDIYTTELVEEKEPKASGYYYYKARRAGGVNTRVGDSEDPSIIWSSSEYKLKTINGKNYLFTRAKEKEYESKINTTCYLSDGLFQEIEASGTNSKGYYQIDGKGDYLVYAKYNAEYSGPCYKAGEWKDYTFVGKTTYISPTFASMEKETWFTTATKNESYFAQLVTANILKGNVNGLDSAIDDLYSALFESNEYKSAIKKIDSVKADVLVPSTLIEALELQQFYGQGEKIKLGKTELNLVKALLNIYKGIFEYVQSIDLSTDLSFLETKKIFSNNSVKGNEFAQYLNTTFTGYDAALDPIANKFLSTRSEKKLAASKETFISVIDDVVAAYDSITGTNSIYPAVVGQYAKQGKVFREAAVALKTAISKGKEFFMPMEMEGIPAAWPTAAGNGILSVNMGEVFGKDLFAINTYLDLCDYSGHKAPSLYIVTGQDASGKPILKNYTELKTISLGQDYICLKVDLSKLEALTNMAAMIPLESEYIPLPVQAAAIIFNFYYTAK